MGSLTNPITNYLNSNTNYTLESTPGNTRLPSHIVGEMRQVNCKHFLLLMSNYPRTAQAAISPPSFTTNKGSELDTPCSKLWPVAAIIDTVTDMW